MWQAGAQIQTATLETENCKDHRAAGNEYEGCSIVLHSFAKLCNNHKV